MAGEYTFHPITSLGETSATSTIIATTPRLPAQAHYSIEQLTRCSTRRRARTPTQPTQRHRRPARRRPPTTATHEPRGPTRLDGATADDRQQDLGRAGGDSGAALDRRVGFCRHASRAGRLPLQAMLVAGPRPAGGRCPRLALKRIPSAPHGDSIGGRLSFMVLKPYRYGRPCAPPDGTPQMPRRGRSSCSERRGGLAIEHGFGQRTCVGARCASQWRKCAGDATRVTRRAPTQCQTGVLLWRGRRSAGRHFGLFTTPTPIGAACASAGGTDVWGYVVGTCCFRFKPRRLVKHWMHLKTHSQCGRSQFCPVYRG